MQHDESDQVFGSEVVRVEPGPVGIRDGRNKLLMQSLSEAQVDFLLQRTPKNEIKTRQGRGGMQFSYVEHGYVTERLNLVFGFNWDFEVTDKQILDDEVIVEAKLTVRTPGGQTIVKTQFGGADIKRHASGARSGRPLSIADDYKAAASDALKKCASLLGIGLDLYGRDRPYETDDTSAPAVTIEQSASPKVTRIGAKSKGFGAAPEFGVVDRPHGVDVGVEVGRMEEVPTGLSSQAQWHEIGKAAAAAGMSVPDLCSCLNVQTLAQLTEARAARVLNRLRELATGYDMKQSS
jgi:hypothetical protein